MFKTTIGAAARFLGALSIATMLASATLLAADNRQQCEAAGKRWVSQAGACANKIAIPLRKVGNSYKVGGVIGGGPVDFTLDTGADLICLPDTMVNRLIALGLLVPDDFIGSGRMRTADGASRMTRRFILRSLVVGDQNVHQVEGTDGCREPLLGQSFLGVFNSYHIDNQHQTLVLD
jgi:predicted aspartyl protease